MHGEGYHSTGHYAHRRFEGALLLHLDAIGTQFDHGQEGQRIEDRPEAVWVGSG